MFEKVLPMNNDPNWSNRRRTHMTLAIYAAVLAVAIIAALLCADAQPAFAYLKFGVRIDGRQIALHWTQTPVRYFVSDRAAVPGVSVGDIILFLDQVEVRGADDDLTRLLNAERIGRPIEIAVLRAGRVHRVMVRPQERRAG